MSDIRNYEEYRAQVLDSLGEDYTVEDLRNFERWRLKVLEGLSEIADPEAIAEAVDAWLDEHPEATTTVADGSITKAKLYADLIAEIEGKADEQDVTDLKTDLDNVLDLVLDGLTKQEITPPLGMESAKVTTAGALTSSGVYDVRYWQSVGTCKFLSVDYSLALTTAVSIAFFSNNSFTQANLVGYIMSCTADELYEIPSGTQYVALTCGTGTTPKITFYENDVLEQIDEIKTEVSNIKSELINENSIVTSTHYPLTRYQILNGVLAITSSSLYDVLNLIPVNGASVFSVDYTLTPASGYGYAPVCFFSDDVENNANLVDYMPSINANTNYSIPNGTEYIGLMVATGSTPTITFYKNRLDVIEDNVNGLVNESERGTTARAPSMGANDSISATVGNLKKNTVLGFSANITTFGSLQIGQGKTTNAETAYLIIDSTNIKVYSYYDSQAHEEGSYTHGLTIADYIDICIEESNSDLGFAKIRITSNGQTYTINSVRWAGCNKTIYADAINGSYTNCLLVYYCADYAKEFWLFGDSYFDHWVPKCLEDGYSNFLCDGFSGRNSSEAFESLERNLLHGKPNTIVWCIGMNNGDSGAVNSSWNTYYTKLKNLCEEKGINLILSTIPNVPTVDNSYKNTIIRNSGYRYVDLAKAVGSDISTSWYTGLLSSDEVHPSSLGDEMIARFMESALPEITK